MTVSLSVALTSHFTFRTWNFSVSWNFCLLKSYNVYESEPAGFDFGASDLCAAPEMIQTAPKKSVFLRSGARLASLRTREALTLLLLCSKRFWEKTTVLQYRNGPHCFSRRTWNNPQLFLEWNGILTLWIKQNVQN